MDGSSLAVNQYDAICMKMQKCLRCAVHDTESEGPMTCDPKSDQHPYSTSYSYSTFLELLLQQWNSAGDGGKKHNVRNMM